MAAKQTYLFALYNNLTEEDSDKAERFLGVGRTELEFDAFIEKMSDFFPDLGSRLVYFEPMEKVDDFLWWFFEHADFLSFEYELQNNYADNYHKELTYYKSVDFIMFKRDLYTYLKESK